MSRRISPHIAGVAILFLLVSSCAPAVPTDAYPTYDPFSPVNGTNVAPAQVQGGEIVDREIPSGPTPTRAPVSVLAPTRDPNAFFGTPTPDSPHAIPSPRQLVDTYTVQAGDTLGSIANVLGLAG